MNIEHLFDDCITLHDCHARFSYFVDSECKLYSGTILAKHITLASKCRVLREEKIIMEMLEALKC